MSSSVAPQSFLFETAHESCQSYPADEKCPICQEVLGDAPLDRNETAAHESQSQIESELSTEPPTNGADDMEAVKTKVCGDMHFFHRICITSWFKSDVPYLNSCPIDRKVLFATDPVLQTAEDLSAFNERIDYMLDSIRATAQEFVATTNSLQAYIENFAVFDDLHEQVIHEGEELEHDELKAAAVQENHVFQGRAFEDVAEPELGGTEHPVDPDFEEIVSADIEKDIENTDDGLTDHIAQGPLPAAQGRPFDKDSTSGVNPDPRLDSDRMNFFGNAKLRRESARLRLPTLGPDSLGYEVPEDNSDVPLMRLLDDIDS